MYHVVTRAMVVGLSLVCWVRSRALGLWFLALTGTVLLVTSLEKSVVSAVSVNVRNFGYSSVRTCQKDSI